MCKKLNIGVTFGAYCPLHQGHMDVIMQAKKENDFCIVLVSGSSNNKYDRSNGMIPFKKRVNKIELFFQDDPLVIVSSIDENLLGIDKNILKPVTDWDWSTWLKKANDIFCLKMWIVAGNLSMVAMYIAWNINCIYGWYNWDKNEKKNIKYE